MRRGTGQRARALGRGDIAGKTGTTNDGRDAWFSGFNPDLVATAWVGFDQERPLGPDEDTLACSRSPGPRAPATRRPLISHTDHQTQRRESISHCTFMIPMSAPRSQRGVPIPPWYYSEAPGSASRDPTGRKVVAKSVQHDEEVLVEAAFSSGTRSLLLQATVA